MFLLPGFSVEMVEHQVVRFVAMMKKFQKHTKPGLPQSAHVWNQQKAQTITEINS